MFNVINSSEISLYKGYSLRKSFKHKDSLILQNINAFLGKNPICFVISGFGSQWPTMAKLLMHLNKFSQTIVEINSVLTEFDVNLWEIYFSEYEKAFYSITSVFIDVTAIQIGLINIFYKIDIKTKFIIGHSFIEIDCAFADQCLTARKLFFVVIGEESVLKRINGLDGWEEPNN